MSLADEKYLAFTTYRRSGEAVTRPVWWVGLDDGRYGFWTSSGSGKAKRLGHTERVQVQPSDARGRPKPGTEPIAGRAVLSQQGDAAHDQVQSRVRAKYGLMTKVTHVLGVLGGIVQRRRIPYGDHVVVVDLTSAQGSMSESAHPATG